MFFRLFIYCIPLLLVVSSSAQERCGTVAYELARQLRNPKKESIDQFEKWMKKAVDQKKDMSSSAQRTQSTLTIPVVIHIIHNGEPIGTGLNISDAQILSQLKVLNDDFNRLNVDQVNTPSLFLSVAGSFDVQFVLAKQDPNGLITNGIERIRGSQSSWTSTDNYLLKSQSYWPAEQYLNIWVTLLTDFLGYTQFPVSPLPGLEDSSNERLTDGIVVNYREFGSIDGGSFDLASKYNKGRTLTHEMGHFFGLRHVWGDINGCSGTDYVNDTPTQSKSTAGCPAHPQVDCSIAKMFQNYLDYSDDVCMNIFTQGQVARMTTVIQNSPRRKELPNSIGLQPPLTVPNDLGIKTILNPGNTSCSGTIVPSILVRNYGNNFITSTQIQVKRNNSVIETKNIVLALAVNSEVQIDFLPVALTAANTSQFDFIITFTNGIPDGNSLNNSKGITTTTPALGILPIAETFSSIPSSWSIQNPDNLKTWQPITANGRTALYINNYDYAEVGAIDRLTTPLIDLTSLPTATLLFDRAYAPYPGTTGERLQILASNTCRFDNSPIVLFNKSDGQLATTTSNLSAFVPTNSQWITEAVSLNQFVGQSIQLAFENTNANGNNVYISNVRIFTGNYLDIALMKLESPSPVSCLANISPFIRIRNTGNVPITSFTTSLTINGGSALLQTFSGLSINSNTEQVIQLNAILLGDGNNQLNISIINPNSIADDNPTNNAGSYNLVVQNTKEIIPLRERFDSNSLLKWSIVSQGQQPLWTTTATNYSTSLVYQSFTNTNLGDEAWLVSPVLDFSKTSKASLFFDASYAKRTTGSESLKILASYDCGINFNDVLFEQSGSQLSSVISQNPWLPSLPIDWKKNFINLDNYTGYTTARIAFVLTNGNGNNFYLDNIDFYTQDSPNQGPVQPAENPYSVYGGIGSPLKITFNLNERKYVRLQIYNSIGQVVSDSSLPDTLNQTYNLDTGEGGSGIYIVRLQIDNQLSATKVYVGN